MADNAWIRHSLLDFHPHDSVSHLRRELRRRGHRQADPNSVANQRCEALFSPIYSSSDKWHGSVWRESTR